ncbi:unnamed protein product [Rotaria magnacalcarata]|uniref:Methyltransferase FkbM domain-containing protein n=2 Tax=Rotaria magnacalcarata TaxID=392030 RepID=A0A819V6H8_9BILA|nr:unnamed protein product [Rotaria magnacalcarata]CAF2133655.1 unnamed protein product [Rotaria magnacalcarata]CAF4090318.1 unnamed protein product [Rotaria magnacalcarata]CAF4104295.1 unnamed protein product [Rotaria magnacalcarata]
MWHTQYSLSSFLRKFWTSYFAWVFSAGIMCLFIVSLKNSFAYDAFRHNQLKSYISSNSKIVTSHELNIIDLNIRIVENFTCFKTNRLFQVIRTTICVHNRTDFVSAYYYGNSIYEQDALHLLFRIFLKYQHLGLIDVGANIGTYTMFAAAMNRFVIAIECFRPNYMRIVKAIQMEKLQQNVILIGNALYSQSGHKLSLSQDPTNIGGQAIYDSSPINKSLDNPYVVKTMRFDDLLPIIKETKKRSFLLKADIEGSEYHIFESGKQVLDYIDIPIIFMEWDKIRYHKARATNIINFLTTRQYIATIDTCKQVNATVPIEQWPVNIFWTKMNGSEIC